MWWSPPGHVLSSQRAEPPSPLLLVPFAFIGKELRGHNIGETTSTSLLSLPWLFRGPGSPGTRGVSSMDEAVEKLHLFLIQSIWQYVWIPYTSFFPSKIVSYNNFALLILGLALRRTTIKIKPHEGSTRHINKGSFPSIQTLWVTRLLNPQGQCSSSTQRTSLMLSDLIFPLYDCIEQRWPVNFFLMSSAGLCRTGSSLMNFNNDVCPSLKVVGQSKLSIHLCFV